jgi:hypothetical protein
MKLHEIIEMNENPVTSLLIEKLIPYKNSLLIYYKEYFTSEPMLMVTDVMNAVQYAKIVPSNEFTEALEEYIENNEEDTKEYSREIIPFQSMMLADL